MRTSTEVGVTIATPTSADKKGGGPLPPLTPRVRRLWVVGIMKRMNAQAFIQGNMLQHYKNKFSAHVLGAYHASQNYCSTSHSFTVAMYTHTGIEITQKLSYYYTVLQTQVVQS